MINVTLTPDFRLTTDGTQFIVKERRTVDPTLAPNWKLRYAQNPALDPTPREVWEDAGYYSLTSAGLSAALDSVRVKQAARSDAETLAQFASQLSAESERIVAALSSGGLRDFYVKLAS